MRVLVLAHQLPYPPDTGGKIRHFHLYSRLAREHDVTWVAPVREIDRRDAEAAEEFCSRVIPIPALGSPQLPTEGPRGALMRVVAHLHWERLFEYCFGYVHAPGLAWMPVTPERRAVVDRAVAESSFDAVICETIGSVELAPLTRQIPRLVSLFDIQSELFRRLRSITQSTIEDRLFYLPELAKIRRYEAHHYRNFTAAVTVSDKDKASLRRLCPRLPVDVVHNGVDLEYYRRGGNAEVEGRVVFVGHFGYPPNSDAARYFCRDIWPIVRQAEHTASFMVVGRDAPADLATVPGVQVVGTVPDIRPYVAQAAVVVVPLRAGGGTRIKILEAMAMDKVVVSTTLGAEGLEVEDGRHIILANAPSDFAEAIVGFLRDPGRRAAMGAEARRLVAEKYSWDIQAERLDGVLHKLAAGRSAHAQSD